jgi:hypothetical protein
MYLMLEYRDLKNAEVELREIVREHPDATSVESSCPTVGQLNLGKAL